MDRQEEEEMIKKEKNLHEQNLILLGLTAFSPPTNKRRSCLFYPNDTAKTMVWDLAISILLLITCTTTPFDLAFSQEIAHVKWYTIVRNTIDILFAIDIVVIFNTAFEDDTLEIIDDRCQIAKDYI